MAWLAASKFDIYGFSKARNHEVIEAFLKQYTYREKSEFYHGLEITIWEHEKYDIDKSFTVGENVSLSEVIEYGVNNKIHGFTNYIYAPFCKPVFEKVTLHFTYDGALVLGLTVDAGIEHDIEKYKNALRLEREILGKFEIVKTSIQRLTPPGRDEEEFDENMKSWLKTHKTLYKL